MSERTMADHLRVGRAVRRFLSQNDQEYSSGNDACPDAPTTEDLAIDSGSYADAATGNIQPMTCSHGSGRAAQCSQCLGSPARQVSQQGAAITVDGVVERDISPPPRTPYVKRSQQQRGGRR